MKIGVKRMWRNCLGLPAIEGGICVEDRGRELQRICTEDDCLSGSEDRADAARFGHRDREVLRTLNA